MKYKIISRFGKYTLIIFKGNKRRFFDISKIEYQTIYNRIVRGIKINSFQIIQLKLFP